MGKILLIGGQKGGSGKSTIAQNIAVCLLQMEYDVMLLDTDKQATSNNWADRRNEAQLPTIHCAQKSGDIYKTARDLSERYSFVIIDAGGQDSRELRSSMVAADLMYIPMRASQADLETMPTIDELLGHARTMNPSLQARAIVSMAPSNPLIKEVDAARELLVNFPSIEVSDCQIQDRKVYRDALLQGKGVVELSNSTAKAEIQLLTQEILECLHQASK